MTLGLLLLATSLFAAEPAPDRQTRLQQQLADQRSAHGETHADVAGTHYNLGGHYQAAGDYSQARHHFEQSHAIYTAVFGADHLKVGDVAGRLGFILKSQGEYDGAAALYDQGLAILGGLHGVDHPDVARLVMEKAALLEARGELDESQRLYEQSLATLSAALGERHRDVSAVMANLASLHQRKGDFETARSLQERSLEIHRAVVGEDDPEVGMGLHNLARVLVDQGDYAGARLLYDQSLENLRPALGDRHPIIAQALSSLAALLLLQGDADGAREMTEESLVILRATYGDVHPAVAQGLNTLGLALESEDQVSARALYAESLEIRQAIFGPNHPQVAPPLNNLATLLMVQGDHDSAQPLLEQAVSIATEAYGPRHPAVVIALGNLGSVLRKQGDLAGARQMLEEGLEIRREALGPDHPDVALSLNGLAIVLEDQGEHEAGRRLRTEALAIVGGRLALLDALSEREALAYIPEVRSTLDGWLTAFSGHEHDAQAWRHVLQFKGAVASRISAEKVSREDDPQAAEVAAELAAVRKELARLSLGSDLTDREGRMRALSGERERLERELMQLSARHRAAREVSAAGPTELCEALPAGAALVDMLRYQRDGKAHYVAMTAMAGECAVRRVELGLAETLDDAVAAWRDVLGHPESLVMRVDARGARVTARVWEPLAAVVGEASHLFVVPDGALAGAPLSALPVGEGRYLLEDRAVTWLDRAHDVLVQSGEVSPGALVVGGVDYDASVMSETEQRGVLAPCNDGDFRPLPGTLAEAEALADRWRPARRGEMLQLGGEEATEARVTEALSDKAVVHLATHGFFATGSCRSALEGDGRVGFDPMVLSGLVLAGANRPSDPLASEDGILTAAEVAGLDLSGTGLVVLSACETGLGEIRSGEGVLGLRRAFRSAGARTLIMTLWSVSDAETASLMDEIYRFHLRRRRPLSAAAALRVAQLNELERQRESGVVRPALWAGWVVAGDWR